MKTTIITIAFLAHFIFAYGQWSSNVPDFPWMKEVGAHTFPSLQTVYNVSDYGAVGDALKLNTEAIQKAIDAAEANGGGIVTFNPGVYLTGSLFIGNNINFNIPKGTMLIGSQNITDYKRIDTRVAGVEMNWPSALINVIGKKNAAITGNGVIHGRGKVFWDKYYAMRKEYDPKGLRWIVDYDCERPRGILISDCEHVTIKEVVLYQPGFWSLHILYSKYVTVDDVIISNNIEGQGPSTDGVDIDSSSFILVQNSTINCNDDNFCLKAGRDSDGLRVNRPCEFIVIRNCTAGHGHGLITCGSETSGGIRNVVAYNLKGNGTNNGIRFKSTSQRGGVIENIYLYNIELVNVANPVVLDLNWHPAYSTSVLPEGYNINEVPVHWKKMLQPVDPKQGTPKFRNVYFSGISAVNAKTCINITGIESSSVDSFHFKNVTLQGEKAGRIHHAKNWIFENFRIIAPDKPDLKNNRQVEIPVK